MLLSWRLPWLDRASEPRPTQIFFPEFKSSIIQNGMWFSHELGSTLPHGVAVVSATGATAWAVRQDDRREEVFGGWGALLGDEGSAYSVGLLGLRLATRAWEGRLDCRTRLPEELCDYFQINPESFRDELVRLVYGRPLSRRDIAGLAPLVTGLAGEDDQAATRIITKVSSDLASLALHAARSLFTPQESFDLAAGGGLLNAGEMMIKPLREKLRLEFPSAGFHLAQQDPAEALGRLAIRRFTMAF